MYDMYTTVGGVLCQPSQPSHTIHHTLLGHTWTVGQITDITHNAGIDERCLLSIKLNVYHGS